MTVTTTPNMLAGAARRAVRPPTPTGTTTTGTTTTATVGDCHGTGRPTVGPPTGTTTTGTTTTGTTPTATAADCHGTGPPTVGPPTGTTTTATTTTATAGDCHGTGPPTVGPPTGTTTTATTTTATAPKVRMGRPGYDRESLVEAAAEVFTERGYDGTTMEVLAATLGVGKSAIYHHVTSREALLGLALDRALDGLDGVVARAQDSCEPAGVRLEQVIHNSVEVLLDRLPSVTLLLRARGNSEVERRALHRRRDFDRFVASLVAQAITEGDLRADLDPTIVARLLFGLVNSVTEWYRPRPAESAPDIAAAICSLAFDGLRRSGAAAKIIPV